MTSRAIAVRQASHKPGMPSRAFWTTSRHGMPVGCYTGSSKEGETYEEGGMHA